MKTNIEKVVKREESGLVATCEICGKSGASAHVPYKVFYEGEYGSGRSGKIAYRCKQHKPNKT